MLVQRRINSYVKGRSTRFSFTYFVPDHFYYSLIQLDSNKLNQQIPDWFVEPKLIHGYGIKDTTQKMTGSSL